MLFVGWIRGKIPRQVTAVLNTVGYPPLSDGGSIVDHSDCFTIINLSKELMDPMKDSKIAFQFLALSLLVVYVRTCIPV